MPASSSKPWQSCCGSFFVAVDGLAPVDANDSGTCGVQRELDAIADADLVEDVVQVRLDRLFSDEETVRHFRIAEPECHKTTHVTLA
jgi:hypothetical protein